MKWTSYFRGSAVATCLAFALVSTLVGQDSHTACGKKILKQPGSYPLGSELYYLAWVEHGNYAQRGASAKRLLEMKSKSNLAIAEKVAACRDLQVFKNMMTLVLFDLDSTRYAKQTTLLLDDNDREMQTNLQGTWIKTEQEFEGEIVDFYFDWGAEAALRLVREGYFSERAMEIVLQLAGSYYRSDRDDAKAILDMFDGIPSIDLTAQPKTINEHPWLRDIERVDKWFAENKRRILWDAKARRYRLKQ